MRKHTSFIGYLGGLIALMIALAACSGGGGSPTPASTPEPTAEETTVVAMLPTEEPTSQASPVPGQRRGDVDTDGDGVFDDVDQCITDGDFGYGIDEFGCPNDTDKDGFADHTDQCPDEADLGLGIDAVGCPIRDTDNDGFTDDVDSCPTEGDLGLGIDAVGCPILDTDGDGITDDVDACYREGDIFGFGVYPDGCPIDDLDGDGYPDNVDACPSAADMGFGMSEDGCPIGDADNDGVGDNVDACQTEGDLGYGVDVEGCPNPEPTPDPEPNGDGDGDGVLNFADACPGEGGIVDALGCPLDSDNDGVVDNDDLCPTEGDAGFGVDATGCPNPDPDIPPIVVDARPTINMGISATCQTTDSGVVAVFELTNPNEIEINHGYTDQNGVAGVANIAPNSTANVTIIPNNDGYARIQFDNVTNFAEITCEMPQPTPEATDAPPVLLPTLSIRNEVCITQGNPRMVIDIFNAGPGVLPAGTQFITTNNSQFILDMDVAPNSGYSMAVFVMNGFGSLQIPAYNFSYANTVACPPPPPTPEVTPPTELAPRMVVAGETCTQNNSGNPVIILSLRNDGTAPLPAGTEFLINTDSPYTLDRDIAVGESWNMTVFMRDGFGTFRIPSLNFYYTNLNPCPVGSAPDNTVRIRVLETTCNAGASQYQLRIINDGPGAIAAGTEIIFTRYMSNGNNPTSTTNFGANVVAGADTRITVFVGDLGITQVSIPAYNFSFTNDVPCTNNAVTGLQLVSATCEPGPNFAPNYPGVRFVLRNFGPNPIPAGLAYTLEGYNNEPGTTGAEIPVGGDFVTGVLMRNSGFARLVIPSLNINVQNPIQCIPPATNLSVSNYTCSFNNRGDAVVSYVITNTGPNLVSGVNVMNIVGLETNSIEIRNAVGDNLGVGNSFTINARPDGNGYVTTSIPIFGFNISNPTPCPPPLPTLSVSAQCVGEYQGEISVVLGGFNQFAMSDIAMFADGVPFPYQIRFDDNSVITATTAIFADGTYTIPYTSANSWRGRQVGFIYDSVRNLIGADNSTDSLVLPLCVPDHVDYSVNISQSCDAQTGINTVTLTATNVISLNRALTFLGANSEDIRRYYQFIGTGLAPLNEQYHVSEGASVYQFNTNGKDALSVSYFNPILVNYNAQRQLGILVARQNVDEYLSVPLELCGNPETPVQIPPSVTIVSATCASDFFGEIEISFANFNNYMREDGTEPFLGGFNYRYQIRDDDQTLIDATQLYDDGTYIISFTWQPEWRNRNLYLDYQTAQSVVSGDVALTSYPLPNCLPQPLPDFSVNFSQSCNPETGINTVTFTPINFSTYEQLWILANANPADTGMDKYLIATNRGIQNIPITADPVTVEVDTNGVTIAVAGHPDFAIINYYMRYFLLGEAYAGTPPVATNALIQYELDKCGVAPQPVDIGEVKAVEPTFTCDALSREIVIHFDFITPQELQTTLTAVLQNSGGMSPQTMLTLFAIVQGSFMPVNYYIHTGNFDLNGTFIQTGIHNPVSDGDLTLRVPYNLLTGGNAFLTYLDFQPLLTYMLDVFEVTVNDGDPNSVPIPDFQTVIVTTPLRDCNIPEIVPITGVCGVYNGQTVALFDVSNFTSNLVNYSVNTPNSLLSMGNPPTVIVYPDSNGYANIRIGNIGFGEITCATDIEVTPEPEITPVPTGDIAVLPTVPVYPVSDIICVDGVPNIVINVSGLANYQIQAQNFYTAIGLQYDPLANIPLSFGDTVTVVLSHTAPLSVISPNMTMPDNVIAVGTMPIASFTDGTYTIPLTVIGERPAGAPIYVSFPNPYRFINALLLNLQVLGDIVNTQGRMPTTEEILGIVSIIQGVLNDTPTTEIASHYISTTAFGGYDVPCLAPEPEITPEPEVTPEVTPNPNQLTLPEPPSFSVDSITCEAVGALTITYTNGDLGAYGMALSAILTQILPQDMPLANDFISAFSSLASMPIVITHTSPVSTSGISTNYIVAVSMSSVTINAGTYTLSFPLAPTGSGMPGMPLGTIPDGAPLYLNMISPRQIGIVMNSLFQPLVDMYNNGETITEETLFNMFSETAGSQSLLLRLFYSQQLEQSLIDTCFSTFRPNLQISVTEQCNAETGINTISFNITGANALSSLLGSSSFPLLIVLNGEQKTLLFQDGVQTMTLDTNGLYVATLQYLNPEYINDALGRALAGGSASSNLPMMVTRILTLCGDTAGDNLTIPELPTPTITSLTCPTPNQLSVTINFGDGEAYANAVEVLIGTVIGSLGMGNIPFDIDTLLSTFGSMAQNVPVIITHTTPLDASVFMLGSMPSNVVGFSSGTATSNGTSTTYTITIIVPPPAGVPLYISHFSQYGFLKRIVDAFVPLVERLKNGEQLSMTDIQNAFTSAISFGGDMQNALASMIISQEIPSDLLEDCITPSVPFSLSISEQCDYGTGVNTISITMGGTSTLATFFSGQQVPFIINGGQYNLSFQDGTQTIEFNTTGLESAQLQYVNPDYLNEMLQAILSQQTPNSQQPPLLTRDLTICVGSPTPEVTPTEEITPVVTPTEEITPIVTPTEEFTPEATPTMEVTPDATPTEQITPDATPTAEVTPSPEVTPIVTLEIPTLPTLPTLPPLPTLEPTPDAPTPFCGATFEIGGQIVIDMTSAGCGVQEERPVQNWTPITIGGAVCLPEIIYHTDETGDWELFWASASRAPENLSNGVGFIDLAPTRSPDGLWIAFSSNRDGNWEIYAATVDGSTVIRLTDNDSAVDFDPSWSPDGTKLVYESNVDGNWELRMINLLTGEKTRLTNHPAPDINPAWHPNGTTIAFQSSREDGLWQIYEYNLVTGTLIRLSDGSADDTNPQYRPDGGTILYQSVDSNGEISLRIMDGQGNPLMNVPVMGSRITNAIWSPDGMYIAYQATPEIGFTTLYVYDVATDTTRQITSNGNAFSPAWICDTTNLVFTSNVLGNNNLYVVNALPMDAEPVDLAVLEPAVGGDANQRDPQNSPAEEDASRGGNLPPK